MRIIPHHVEETKHDIGGTPRVDSTRLLRRREERSPDRREFRCSHKAVTKALASAEPTPYTLRMSRAAPALKPFKERIGELLAESSTMPRNTARKIFEILSGEGYVGSEVTVRRFVAGQREAAWRLEVYLPLEFEPGMDAQVDWTNATVVLGEGRRVVQLFVTRLCHSRRPFVMAFPGQKQEAFFEGHRCAFRVFGGVPYSIAYDNLKMALRRILEGHNREEQRSFVVFRSQCLFESRFCTPSTAREKGSVEHVGGFARRNSPVPLPEVACFDELKRLIKEGCRRGRTPRYREALHERLRAQ